MCVGVPASSSMHHPLILYICTLSPCQKYDSEVGKVIGGTRGNVVLEFVSGAPNKQRIQEEAPDIFDYDEVSVHTTCSRSLLFPCNNIIHLYNLPFCHSWKNMGMVIW